MALLTRAGASSGKGMGISVTVNDAEIRAHLRALGTKGRLIVMKALNRAIRRANTQAKRSISRKRNIKQSLAKRSIKMHRATKTRLEAMLEARGGSIPLADVKGAKTQTKRGVKANPGTGRRLFEGAFLAKRKGGGIGVFERVFPDQRSRAFYLKRVGAGGRVYYSEFPIREIKIPSIPSTMVQKDIMVAIDKVARPEYRKEVRRLLILEQKKAKRAGGGRGR